LDPSLERARALIESSHRIAVLTGAGISAESGIPTFRDALTGLWSKFKPEDLATPEAFRKNPKLVWDWYAGRREKVGGVSPNAGHRALAALQEHKDLILITQNVDGLHQAAGSRDVIELHGNIRRVKCFDNDHIAKSWTDGDPVPRCAVCGSMLRPDVVWFGEVLPEEALSEAMGAAADCDVFLSIGTSSVVEPAALLPGIAKNSGAKVIEVNPAETPITAIADFSFRGAAGVVLPALLG
jgi:NAD-dependent deacetylase